MEKAVRVFILILVLHALNFALANKSSSLSLADDCSLLFQFKENMSINKHASSDPHAYPKVASWSLNTSDGARSCCIWEGVECRFGHVIGLDLSSSLLYGPISSNNSLLSLIHLHTLNLADNDFCSSQIPSGIGRLSQLAYLNLSCSFFSGEVPKQISQLRNLASLDLSRNYGLKLHSSDLKNLVQNTSETLTELFLSDVNIHSELPGNLVNASLLASLVMRYCGLGGDFPAGIFNLQTLQVLDVQDNYQLTGYIPEFHGNSELEYLSVERTKFQGSLPASIGNLTHLNILNLRDCYFTGTLPASVSNLTRLTALHLGGNNFTGSLPSLKSLSKLKYLCLYENSFDRWKLPNWFGMLTKITWLDLHDSNLYGEIPSSFFNMTQLTMLYLHGNQLKGQLSSSLLNLQNLADFYLNDNNVTVDFYLFLSLKNLGWLDLSGNNITLPVIDSHTNENHPKFTELSLSSCNLKVFPEFLRFQHQLEYLHLDNNKIEGLIPGWMWNISRETLFVISLTHNLLVGFEQHSPVVPWYSLHILDLSHNMLSDEILPSICELVSLWFLELSFNNIIGSIPPCLQKLIMLSLRSNNLQGTIPNIFTNESNLEIIDLSENKLEGPLPRSLENCESLEILDLRRNTLQGTIPNIFTNESKLEIIDLSENKLEGPLPTSLENCESLQILNLRKNSLRGTIPNIFINKSKLQTIDLSENKLEGSLPRSLENCESLHILDLGRNLIEDMFPFWLGTLSELEVLILRFNKFHGIIRMPRKIKVNFPKLHIIDLSYNSFFGYLPNQYFQGWSAMLETKGNARYMQLKNINDLYQWRDMTFSMQMTNKGVIMEYVKIMNTFYAVDFSSNMFRGKIPESINTLSGLKLLNLSNNELSGIIPPSIGNLIRLESLDLSSNKLSGMIPQNLVQLNFLEVLNVSNNNLTGPIPQGKQFDTFSNNSYMGNQALCGFPLSIKCGDSKASEPPKVPFEDDTESYLPHGIDWVVILFGVVSGLVIGIVCGDYLTTRYYELFFS